MTFAWYLIVAYVIGATIHEIGGAVALAVAVGILVANSLWVHYPAWVPRRVCRSSRSNCCPTTWTSTCPAPS